MLNISLWCVSVNLEIMSMAEVIPIMYVFRQQKLELEKQFLKKFEIKKSYQFHVKQKWDRKTAVSLYCCCLHRSALAACVQYSKLLEIKIPERHLFLPD